MANRSWLNRKKNSESSAGRFLKVKPDCKLNVRLIDDPVRVVRAFSYDRKCAVLDDEYTGQRLKSKYPDKISGVTVRYACWCIDREDKSMKILDMPASVARVFGSRESLIGKKISGTDEGCDWRIKTNGRQGMDVRYEAVYLEETPLSTAEKQTVEEHKSELYGHFDLTRIFKSHSFCDAEVKLFG